MSDIKYSIIIPHYNDFARLTRLLATIPDTSNIEVIIIDDNSTLSASFDLFITSRHNVQIIKNTENKGAGYCRNIGIDLSTGQWLLFSDSDDTFTEDAFCFLNKNLEYFENFNLVFFEPVSISESPDLVLRDSYYKNLIDNFLSFNDNDILFKFDVPWSKLIKTSFVKSNGFRFTETMVANDIFFSILLAVNLKSGDFTAQNKTIYKICERSGSLTSSLTFNKANQRIYVINKVNELLHNQCDANIRKHQFDFLTILFYYSKAIGPTCTLKQLLYMLKNRHPIISMRSFKKILKKYGL
ncbi:glycosyltransferase family 2 protein [Shewanella scandinavica]|uniref:glycosyltransferase family 2 protein n=1 Tax=Shewanella scandinavica TaxID=3063538 RepID=UPI00319207E0